MPNRDDMKASLISLLADLEPIIIDNSILVDGLKISVTGSGYASITIGRALDHSFFEKVFIRWDYYIEGNEASITLSPSKNVFFYGNDGTHDVVFGPEFDPTLLSTVFTYIDRNFPGKHARITEWVGTQRY